MSRCRSPPEGKPGTSGPALACFLLTPGRHVISFSRLYVSPSGSTEGEAPTLGASATPGEKGVAIVMDPGAEWILRGGSPGCGVDAVSDREETGGQGGCRRRSQRTDARRGTSTVNIRLCGSLVHFVAHLVFQEIYSLTTATSCSLLDRTNEMRSFRAIVRCCSLVRPQRSRSSQLLLSSQFWPMWSKSRPGLGQLPIGGSTLSG